MVYCFNIQIDYYIIKIVFRFVSLWRSIFVNSKHFIIVFTILFFFFVFCLFFHLQASECKFIEFVCNGMEDYIFHFRSHGEKQKKNDEKNIAKRIDFSMHLNNMNISVSSTKTKNCVLKR